MLSFLESLPIVGNPANRTGQRAAVPTRDIASSVAVPHLLAGTVNRADRSVLDAGESRTDGGQGTTRRKGQRLTRHSTVDTLRSAKRHQASYTGATHTEARPSGQRVPP